MQTKVVISGGMADIPNVQNDKFFTEILEDTKEEVNILIILFAKPPEKWDEKSKAIIGQFGRIRVDNKLSFIVASHEKFEQQVKNADIVYIRGGDTPLLLKAMQKHPGFKDLLKGKVVAGESAGTYLLSEWFYSKTAKLSQGLGVLPIKSICHFNAENEYRNNEYRLGECPKHLEKVLLDDFEYKVYYV